MRSTTSQRDLVSMATFRKVVCFVLLSFVGCNKSVAPSPDHRRLTQQVSLQDVTFYSASLGRSMQYRVIMPAIVVAGHRLFVDWRRSWLSESFTTSFMLFRADTTGTNGMSNYLRCFKACLLT
jgi:hypothetical protein